MGDTVIIKRKVRRDFTPLPNDLIRDKRLSWGALGLLVFVLHLPDNFKLRLSHLAKQKANGKDATRARVKELEASGYLTITRERGENGQFSSTSWEVTDSPEHTECGTPPRSENPITVPLNGAGRSSNSQINAGTSLRKVKLCDQPASLITVAFKMGSPVAYKFRLAPTHKSLVRLKMYAKRSTFSGY